MAVNTAFHTSNLHSIATERNLYSDLIKEAIQIYGHDVYYMDRTIVAEDNILGEDSLSKYRTQHPIEMYMEDGDGGFAGERELINQFGLQNLSEATFVVNKSRFQELDRQMQIEDGTDTSSGGSILLEAGSISQSSNSSVLTTVTGDNNFYIIQDTAATDSDRPQEGDVIYHPVLDKMFQINFVDHDEPFYQLDSNPVYKMRCRLYDYSSEIIDTGISDIDAIETEQSQSALIYQFTLEQSSAVNEEIRLETGTDDLDTGLLLEETDGDNIVGESDSTSVGESIILEQAADSGDNQYLLQEDYIVGDFDQDKTSQNELFETKSRTVLDFSESNPFGDAGSSS
uniref:Neck protein n=1 Tax=uncultured Bacteroidota bacterium TaxID=152509 RepID=A0A1B0Z1Q8_9BACT|nr:neck protein [uncultured Bacteroidetes bacterium]